MPDVNPTTLHNFASQRADNREIRLVRKALALLRARPFNG